MSFETGGMSVHAHVLSPSNNGLFSGAIAQSGSILFVSYGYESGKEKYFAENALKALGCPTSMDQWSLNCLQVRDAMNYRKKISFQLLISPLQMIITRLVSVTDLNYYFSWQLSSGS